MDDATKELQNYVEVLNNEVQEWKNACRSAFARIYKEFEKLKNKVEWLELYKEGATS